MFNRGHSVTFCAFAALNQKCASCERALIGVNMNELKSANLVDKKVCSLFCMVFGVERLFREILTISEIYIRNSRKPIPTKCTCSSIEPITPIFLEVV
jgi:hypothetical protein